MTRPRPAQSSAERSSDPRCRPSGRLPKPLEGGAGLDPGPLRTLRILVVTVLACGMLGLAVAGLLAAEWAAFGIVSIGGAELLAAWWRDAPGHLTRRVASFAVVASVLITLMVGPSALGQTPEVLAQALLGLGLAHALVHDTARDLAVGMIIGALMLVLASATSGGLTVAVPVFLGWAAVVAGLTTLHSAQQARAAHVAAPAPRPTSSPHHLGTMSRALAVVAVTAVVVLLLVPVPDGSQLRGRLGAGPNAGQQDGPLGGLGVRSASTYTSGAMDLRLRGDLSDDPVAYVPEDSPSLWRGTVYDTYERGTWLSTPAGGTGTFREIPQDAPIIAPPEEGFVGPPADYQTYPVAVTEYFAGVLVAPGRPVFLKTRGPILDSPGALQVVAADGWDLDGYLAKNAQVSYLVASTPIPTVAEIGVRDDAPLPVVGREATTLDPSAAWTQIPDSVPQRVRDLGVSLVASSSSTADAIRRVEDYVRANATYTLDSPVTPSGDDVVDDFLFESRLGFCEHYASAAAILLRSAGIPARVVTGFSSDPISTDTGWRPLRVDEAHAWVEAWLPGVGWVSSDPTAGTALATESTSWTSRIANAARNLVSGVEGQARVVVALLLVAGVIVTLLRRRRQSRPSTDPTAARVISSKSGEVEPLPAFRRLEHALASVGSPRSPIETPTEWGARLTVPGTDRSAFEVASDAAYAPSPPPADRAAAATTDLDSLAEQARRRALRKDDAK